MNFRRFIATLGTLALAATAFADSSATPPRLPGKVAFEQKLDAQVPLDLLFRDEHGEVVRLDKYINGKKPVVLNFMYFTCPMLCNMVQEGTTNVLGQLPFTVGEEFDVITVSIDARDKPPAALQMKERYVRRYGKMSAAAGWHFLTGSEMFITKLSQAVGFDYAYDEQTNQFAHAAGIIVLTPKGRVSRYFFGTEYKARDLRLGLVEASANRIGGTAEQLLLLCYHYDPATGKYTRTAMTFVRAGGVATMLALSGFIFVMVRKDRRTPPTADGESSSSRGTHRS